MKLFVMMLLVCVAANETLAELGPPKPTVLRTKVTALTDECALYGGTDAYFHCAIITSASRRKPSRMSALTLRKRQTRNRRFARPLMASLKVTASPPAVTARPAAFRTPCAVSMDTCYSNCKKVGGDSNACDRSCTTDLICKAPLRLTYGQFLEFELEMLAISR